MVSPPPCATSTHSAAFLYLAVALVATDSSSLGGASLPSPPPHCFHHHRLPICSPPSFVDCCVDWWMRSFVELPFTPTLFLLPLPCTVWLLCCYCCHCWHDCPSFDVVASYKGWLLLFRQGSMALALVVLPVCGASSSLWSLCGIVIVVNHNQTAATPRHDGPQPPTSPPLPSLTADCCIIVVIASWMDIKREDKDTTVASR